MTSLQTRLNLLHGNLIQLLVSGKGGAYANKDLIEFKPGTIEKINGLLAQRNLILEMMEEECKNLQHARNKTSEEETVNVDTTGVVGESDSR